MSPFIFGSPENKQGFYGITNMNFQVNVASNANRAWRSVLFRNILGTSVLIRLLQLKAFLAPL